MSFRLLMTAVLQFLSTDTSEVLCIKGKWGVGKTYSWKFFLNEAKRSGRLKLDRYSYVSLFGLNSLEDLRFAIFEHTVIGASIGNDPDPESFAKLLRDHASLRLLKPLIAGLSTLLNRNGLADIFVRSAFLMVRKQIVCLDDLERAGVGLAVRDVLGLVSQLKEERHCKVVLLLNDEEHDERIEFERQLEKIADTIFVFELTSSEAIGVVLNNADPITKLITSHIVELGISNIRVINKIRHQATRIADILRGYDQYVVDQAIATVVLGSWSVQQPNLAPSLEFIRSHNPITIAMRAGREEIDDATARYRSLIQNYPFEGADELDLVILDGVAAGYFKDDDLRRAADAVQHQGRQSRKENKFSQTWQDLYHGSLAIDDDAFLDKLYESAFEEAEFISPVNINSAIRMLREFGRNEQADAVVTAYIKAHDKIGPGFFNIHSHHFTEEDRIDDALREAFAAQSATYVDARNPLEVLRSMGQRRGWKEIDVALMAKQSAGDFERMFEALRGDNLRSSVDIILNLGRSNLEASGGIRDASLEALPSIARKSELRARKIRAFGIEIDP